jgi:hypothetical protein
MSNTVPLQLDIKEALAMPHLISGAVKAIKMETVGEYRHYELKFERNPLMGEEEFDYLTKIVQRAIENFLRFNVDNRGFIGKRTDTELKRDGKNNASISFSIKEDFTSCRKITDWQLSVTMAYGTVRTNTKAAAQLQKFTKEFIEENDRKIQNIIGDVAKSQKKLDNYNEIKEGVNAIANANAQDLGNLLNKYQALGDIRDNLNTKELDLLIKIINFSADPTQLYYNNVDRNNAAFLLFQAIVEPSIIDQGMGSVCGAAAFTHLLISSYPELFVNASIELLQKGRAKINGLSLVCSDTRETDVNVAFLDALMNAANPIVGYNRRNCELIENILGRTRAKIVAGMMRSAGLEDIKTHIVDLDQLASLGGIIGTEVWNAITTVVQMYEEPKSTELFDKNISELAVEFNDPSYRSIFIINASLVEEIQNIISESLLSGTKQINWKEKLAAKDRLSNPSFVDVLWSKHYINVKSFTIDPNKEFVTLSFESWGKDFKDIIVPMDIFRRNYACNISGKLNLERGQLLSRFEDLFRSIEQKQQDNIVQLVKEFFNPKTAEQIRKKVYNLTTEEIKGLINGVNNQAQTEHKPITLAMIETELHEIASVREPARIERVSFFKSKEQVEQVQASMQQKMVI